MDGAHDKLILIFFSTEWHNGMHLCESIFRGKFNPVFCLCQGIRKLQCLFLSIVPNILNFFEGSLCQKHVMKKKNVACDNMSLQAMYHFHYYSLAQVSLRLCSCRFACVHLHIPAVACFGITGSPDPDAIFSRLTWDVLFERAPAWMQSGTHPHSHWDQDCTSEAVSPPIFPDVSDRCKLVSLSSHMSCYFVIKSDNPWQFVKHFQWHGGLKNRPPHLTIP